MSKQKIARVTVDQEAGTVTWNFANDERRRIRWEDLSPEMQKAAGLHGLTQKGSDCYASAASKYHEDGFSNPVDWAINEQDAVLDSIRNGEWNRSGSLGGLVYEAIAAAMKQPLETVLAAFDAMSKDAREEKLKQIRKHPAFKAEYTKMQAERAAKKVAGAEVEALVL
jgi:hypothetical protein